MKHMPAPCDGRLDRICFRQQCLHRTTKPPSHTAVPNNDCAWLDPDRLSTPASGSFVLSKVGCPQKKDWHWQQRVEHNIPVSRATPTCPGQYVHGVLPVCLAMLISALIAQQARFWSRRFMCLTSWKGWTMDVRGYCAAPPLYEGQCSLRIDTKRMTAQQKQAISDACQVFWPCLAA